MTYANNFALNWTEYQQKFVPRKNVKFKLKFKFKLFIYFMQNILQVDWAADSLEPIMADQSSYTICLELPFGLFTH